MLPVVLVSDQELIKILFASLHRMMKGEPLPARFQQVWLDTANCMGIAKLLFNARFKLVAEIFNGAL